MDSNDTSPCPWYPFSDSSRNPFSTFDINLWIYYYGNNCFVPNLGLTSSSKLVPIGSVNTSGCEVYIIASMKGVSLIRCTYFPSKVSFR